MARPRAAGLIICGARCPTTPARPQVVVDAIGVELSRRYTTVCAVAVSRAISWIIRATLGSMSRPHLVRLAVALALLAEAREGRAQCTT
jgi:hypothetical protein